MDDKDAVELQNWMAYKFGTFEYRLCGYVLRDGQVHKCVVTEPIQAVDAVTGIVETVDSMKWKPIEPIRTAEKMDMMYVISRWSELNLKGVPSESANTVLESLGRIKKDDTSI